MVGVVRGGSVGVRARVPEPAGGRVQYGNGGAEKDSVRLVGDLLSRWVSVPALPVRAVAVFWSV